MNRLTLSCFILTFKNAEYLDRAATSVASQTRRPDRTVILVMDCLEESARIGREQAERWGFECRVSPPPVFRHAAAKNVAATMSRTDCFMLLDGDDWIEPDFVSECMGRMEAASSLLAAVGCDYRWAGLQSGKAPLPPVDRPDLANPLPACSVIRATAYQAAFGFRDAMSEDWLFWRTLHDLGYRLARVPRVLMNYFQHNKSLCRRLKHIPDFAPMERPQ